MQRALLSNVTVLEGGAGAAVAVAGRLLAQFGATVTKADPNGHEVVDALREARIILLDDAEGPAPHCNQIVARVHSDRDDLLLQAAAGICAGIGEPKRPPLKLPLDQSAQQGGLTLALAASAALFSTEPQRIDVSVLDVWTAFYAGPEVANARFGRAKTRRGGHRAVGVPWPRTILRCKDGFFAIQCATRDHWLRFLSLVGKPELEAAPLFADRIKANDLHGDDADAIFADWFGARTKAELAQSFLDAKIPGAPVYTIDEVAHHEHLRLRRAFRDGFRVNLPFELEEHGRAEHHRSTPAFSTAPLKGVRVVDFGWVWAGAVPGQILADLGAEVIKIETATRLDYMRQGRPIVGTQRDPEQNPMFQAVNRGKLSLRVDMTTPQGAALLRDLVAKSDIVIENFSPGVLDRYRLGWKVLSAVSPGVVMCSMSAAGATGPFRDIRTYATMIAGLCGLDSMVGYPGERVLGSQSSYCDPNASLHATLAILAALFHREQTGAGCWIDLSQWQAGLHAVDEALSRYATDGTIPGPNGLQREDRIVHGCFPTANDDVWIAISVRDEHGFDALRQALDAPQATPQTLAEITRAFAIDDLERRLPKQLAARVKKAEELYDPALFEEVQHPILGAVPTYRLPWLIDGERPSIRSRAPLLGEHNEYVLRQILALDDDRIAELRDEHVFE